MSGISHVKLEAGTKMGGTTPYIKAHHFLKNKLCPTLIMRLTGVRRWMRG
jgi:hypothetical protein